MVVFSPNKEITLPSDLIDLVYSAFAIIKK